MTDENSDAENLEEGQRLPEEAFRRLFGTPKTEKQEPEETAGAGMAEEEADEEEQNQFMPIEVPKRRPVDSDFQLSEKLMEVKGRTARDNLVVDIVDKDGKFLGKDVVGVKNIFYEIISEDMTKANLGAGDLALVRGLCMRSNHTQAISKAFEVNLSPTQKMLADAVLIFLTSSRGKGGWNAMLSKTDKTITQQSLEQFTKQIQADQEQRKSWWKPW